MVAIFGAGVQDALTGSCFDASEELLLVSALVGRSITKPIFSQCYNFLPPENLRNLCLRLSEVFRGKKTGTLAYW